MDLDTTADELKDHFGEEIVDRALARIRAGTVTLTQHGWRVECRPEFSDNRKQAVAYWIKDTALDIDDDRRSCKCRQGKTVGVCSHWVAAFLASLCKPAGTDQRRPLDAWAKAAWWGVCGHCSLGRAMLASEGSPPCRLTPGCSGQIVRTDERLPAI